MFSRAQSLPPLLAFVLLVPCSSSQASNSEDDLNVGISAYEKASYDEAIEHLKRVVSLDPKHVQAHFYLAMSYNEKYVPNAETEYDNTYWLSLALHEYEQVLALEPTHKGALLRLAYIFYGEKKYAEAEEHYRKVLETYPGEPEALYLLGVINFARSYETRIEERVKLGIPSKTRLIESSGCHAIRVENIANIQEGIEFLERLATFTTDGKSEVQAYISLLYRERAEIECEDEQAYAADLRAAEKSQLAAAELLHHENRNSIPIRWPPAPPPPDNF